MRHLSEDLGFMDPSTPTIIYNDNQACVDWAATLTVKGIKHLNLRENKIRESHASNDIAVTHIPGAVNCSDIHTKEIKDAAHFRRLRDTIVVSLPNFLKYGHTIPSHLTT